MVIIQIKNNQIYIKFSWRPRFFQFHEGTRQRGWTKVLQYNNLNNKI